MTSIKNISEVTEPLKEEILNGHVHTIDEMKVWLKPFGYSDAINDVAINFILREFVMSKVSCDEMSNMDKRDTNLSPVTLHAHLENQKRCQPDMHPAGFFIG